ncbi:hypothetical protein ACFYTF_20890 [Nocardia thailandica]|uniref:Cobalamin-independent methionine synthase MetE C-terminal/archaeal domain-containing protein n=1 Tax=Nocardia thailandica TaxID=257275 RepID=A0ABW6PSB6_9NOCA
MAISPRLATRTLENIDPRYPLPPARPTGIGPSQHSSHHWLAGLRSCVHRAVISHRGAPAGVRNPLGITAGDGRFARPGRTRGQAVGHPPGREVLLVTPGPGLPVSGRRGRRWRTRPVRPRGFRRRRPGLPRRCRNPRAGEKESGGNPGLPPTSATPSTYFGHPGRAPATRRHPVAAPPSTPVEGVVLDRIAATRPRRWPSAPVRLSTPIACPDTDVASIEAARSCIKILGDSNAAGFDVGVGLYDIHSPRVRSVAGITDPLRAALKAVPAEQLRVDPPAACRPEVRPKSPTAARPGPRHLVAAHTLHRPREVGAPVPPAKTSQGGTGAPAGGTAGPRGDPQHRVDGPTGLLRTLHSPLHAQNPLQDRASPIGCEQSSELCERCALGSLPCARCTRAPGCADCAKNGG